MNSEFQRIARRDKKAFLSDQYKEIEESNRMGKTRDLFKKIRDTKGAFHAKMGTIKSRNGPNRSRRYKEDNSFNGPIREDHVHVYKDHKGLIVLTLHRLTEIK